jgi:hypothetical protein
VYYIATTPGEKAMDNRFEEVLFNALYEVMEQAWDRNESEFQALNQRLAEQDPENA